jgi:hypothetical protein
MEYGSESKRGWQLVESLSPYEDRCCEDFRQAVKDSATSEWYADAVVQAYHLAGSGEWDDTTIYTTQMLLTAIEERPALLPVIAADVERMLDRFERLGSSYRATWNHVRAKLAQKETVKEESAGQAT